MRLIDAELVAKNIARHKIIALEVGNDEMNKLMECYNPSSFSAGFDYGMKLAMELVANQPTAYDPDKVMQRLKEFEGLWEPSLSEVLEIVKGGVADET